MPTDFDTTHLDGEARRIADAIVAFLTADKGEPPYGGGGCGFYSPEQWRERGEDYGTQSLLVLVHDGGDLAAYCNYDYGCYDQIDKLTDALGQLGYYVEQCTSWYSAVYPTRAETTAEPEPANGCLALLDENVVGRLAQDLAAALIAAKEASSALKDGGTCCLDTVKVRSAAYSASKADLVEAGRFVGVNVDLLAEGTILPPTNAQGTPRTVACEVLSKVLNARGWSTTVRYVMD